MITSNITERIQQFPIQTTLREYRKQIEELEKNVL
jgi:hypothetical protein